jgi:hypothetical protein
MPGKNGYLHRSVHAVTYYFRKRAMSTLFSRLTTCIEKPSKRKENLVSDAFFKVGKFISFITVKWPECIAYKFC